MKNKLLIFISCVVLFSCKSPHNTISGHDCSFSPKTIKDSIFITGEHIHLLPEELCSYTEDEWYVFEEDTDTNHLIID